MVLCELRTFWSLVPYYLPASEELMSWDGGAGAWASLPLSHGLVSLWK
jgi:hypothetical protein